jgi:hypothetical protein
MAPPAYEGGEHMTTAQRWLALAPLAALDIALFWAWS